jgi:hypothetical protein
MNPYDELARAWRAVRGERDLRMREVACVDAPRTLLVVEAGPLHAPTIAIHAGVHGDEPAGAWALYECVRDGLLDTRFAYRLWPCVNPSGFARGTRRNADGDDVNRSFSRGGSTPEARAIVTANRDRRFALSLDLHEDHEATGFYLYEPTRDRPASYGAPVTGAMIDAGFPLQRIAAGFDLGNPPGAETVQTISPGSVVSEAAAESAYFAGALPWSLFVMRRAAEAALTFEAPQTLAWERRIVILRTAIVAAIGHCARIALPRSPTLD